MDQYQNIIGPVSKYIRTRTKIYNIPNTSTIYTDQKYKIYGPKVHIIRFGDPSPCESCKDVYIHAEKRQFPCLKEKKVQLDPQYRV